MLVQRYIRANEGGLVLVAEVLRRHVLGELEGLGHGVVLLRRGAEGRLDVARVREGILGSVRHAAVAEPEAGCTGWGSRVAVRSSPVPRPARRGWRSPSS
jgi:hypothetical protein